MKRKLTILHTEASKGWGGQEIRVIQESLRFHEIGYRILIACHEDSGIAEKAEEVGLPVYIVPMRFSCDPLAIIKFVRLIKTEEVDIIHTHSSKDSWIAGIAGRISGTPVIRSRHLTTPVKQTRTAAIVYRYLCDVIITSGISIKNALVTDNRINPKKIVSIPAGVDTERFNLEIKGNKVRKELGLEHAYPIVGIVAILRHWKGHKYLLQAVPEVVSKYPEARFVISGNGPQWDNLHAQIRDLGIERNVIMTGFRKDVPEIMAALDIFILPSVASEATSQVIPQALAVGRPVIAANAGGLSEIIEDGVTGRLIPPKDPSAIANAIIRMADNREEAGKMAVNGRMKILEGYTLQKMIESTADVYDSLITELGK
jgi:glycosyltransferase involved in cell wall biosynthesis